MKLYRGCATVAALALWSAIRLGAADPAPTFKEDFSAAAVGSVPDGFLVLDGEFAVREADGNRFLELPGAPLETFGVMFGTGNKENWGVQARIRGSGKGRKFPVFGIGINGLAGYRLYVAPGKKSIELLKGDIVEVSKPFEWSGKAWTRLRLQIRKLSDTEWKVEGKAWEDGTPEPTEWLLSWDEKEKPISGRPAVWGVPYAGTPIQFDDLQIVPVAP
jgi:hypothetical protein